MLTLKIVQADETISIQECSAVSVYKNGSLDYSVNDKPGDIFEPGGIFTAAYVMNEVGKTVLAHRFPKAK